MDAVTYPDARVADFVSKTIIPLRIRYDAEPLASQFNVQWTPTLIALDPDGKEHHRTIGYVSPEELLPSLLLGTAKWHFDSKQWDQATPVLERVVAEYPESDSAPEALYLLGASRYKVSHDLKDLREMYKQLMDRYPSTVWAKRASPYQPA